MKKSKGCEEITTVINILAQILTKSEAFPNTLEKWALSR